MHRSFETQHVQLLQTHATHSFVGIILPHRAETRLVDACAGSSSWLAQYSLMSSGSRSSRHVYVAAASHAFVSQSGIVAVLKSVREHGLPDAISRPTLKRTRREAMPDMTPLGPLHGSVDLQTTDGGMVKLPVMNPWALLHATLERCESFRDFFEGVMASCKNTAETPFKVALYCDEILPGDQLKPTNQRKLVAFYWSLLEFKGQLGRDGLWWQIAICRTSHVKRIAGHYSQIFKQICNLFQTPPYDGRRGLQLPLRGPCKFGFFKVGLLLADEAALKQCWSNKGSSGLFICLFCQNVTNHLLNVAVHDKSNWLVPSSVCSLDRCVLHTDESVMAAVRKLKSDRPGMGKGAFEELEKSLGLTFAPEGALFDENFMSSIPGVVSMTSFDWMHVYLVSGLWNSEVPLLIDKVKQEHAMGLLDFVVYLKSLSWPKKVSSRGTSGIKAVEKLKDGQLSCSASEGLSLYPTLRAFLMTQVPQSVGAAAKAVHSYYCLAAALDLLQRTRSESVSPIEL